MVSLAASIGATRCRRRALARMAIEDTPEQTVRHSMVNIETIVRLAVVNSAVLGLAAT